MPQSRSVGRRRHLVFLLIAGLVTPAILFAVNLVQSRAHALASGQDRLVRRAAVLAEHAARVFDGYDLAFDLVDRDMANLSDDAIRADDRAYRELAALVPRMAGGGTLAVLGSAGDILATSNGRLSVGQDRADRDYFQLARQSPGLVIGQQIVGRVYQQRGFTLARQGSGDRILVAMVLAEYFERHFATLPDKEGADLVVALYREDGKQLVRYPEHAESADLTQHIAGAESGIYRRQPLAGGEEKQYAFARVPGYPVYATYGIAMGDLLADWRASMVQSGLLALATSLLLGGFTLHAIRRADEAARNAEDLASAVTARTAEAGEAIQAREEALQIAERANASKAHFMAAASHDLRQPIQGLRLFLEVLDGRLTIPDNQRVLGLAKKALEGAEDLLSTLLDVSTLEAGMIRPSLRPVPAAEVLDHLAEEFRKQAETRSLSLRYVPCGALLETDPVLLARLLRNLLTNAIRYTQKGGILLGCRRRGDFVSIQVWDTGSGIPADKLDAVFEDFVQLANPERDRGKGLGLGLAVVRRMARLMGHNIEVRSVEGKGTMFSLLVRLATQPGTQSSPT